MSKIPDEHRADRDLIESVILIALNETNYIKDFKSLKGCPEGQLDCLRAIATSASYDYMIMMTEHLKDCLLVEYQLEATVSALLDTSTYEIGDQGDT